MDADTQLVQRIVAAEEELETGYFEATIENGQGLNASSRMMFDLGNVTGSPRLHFVSAYSSTEGQRTTELIVIDDTIWERAGDGEWVEVDAREGVWGQIQSYLPGVAAVTGTGQLRVENNLLTWFDPIRDIDVTLQVDPGTGIPQQLRRASRTTGTVITVTYSGWNSPVEIQMPSTP